MKFEYTGRHVEVTPTIRAHVEDHFGKIVHLFDDSTARAHVRIEVEKNRHIGEIVVHWREHTLTATDSNDDMYTALTRAIDKIEKQAVKLKKKIIERHQSASRLQTLETTTTADGTAAIDARQAALSNNAGKKSGNGGAANNTTSADAVRQDGRQPRIINARRYAVKPMTPEEAIMRLTEEANQFLVFRDSQSERISVLYKRSDGNYGLIEP